jgi:antibiotic biosynthesis monooxygenase (ABM) superfamily enzyme
MAQPAIPPYDGATVVITHRIRNNRHDAYEAWMESISLLCKAATGFLDSQIVRPIPGITATYTVIIRFDTTKNLKGWMESNDRKRLIKAVKPLLVGADDFYISSGLDFWFVPGGARAKVPKRWKQFLITWSAIYPLALFLPLVILPRLRTLGVPSYPPLNTLVDTAAIVFFMVYLIMPRYTRIVQKWLFS